MGEDVLKKAIDYFKNEKAYRKLFSKFYKKYESLGRFGGRINLASFSDEEKNILKGFINMKGGGKSVSWEMMEKSLKESKFEKLKWEDIIENVLEKKLVSKKEIQKKTLEEKEVFFEKIIEENKNSIGISWFERSIKNKEGMYLSIIQKYNLNKEELQQELKFFFRGLSLLPISKGEDFEETLPIFATNVTGNPHSFDDGKFLEKLLLSFLEEYYKFSKINQESPSEYKSRILSRVNIIKDELSNDVLIYGVSARDKKNTVHQGIEGFLEGREPLRLTIYNLEKLKKLISVDRKVYIVENPSVFLELIKSNPRLTVVCGNGQIRRAVLIALDLFDEETTFYYTGDFDPEGLLIAEKLKNRYRDRLKFFGYDVKIYLDNISEVEIDNSRLKKLEVLKSEELLAIKGKMLKEKRAVYQEQFFKKLIKTL